MRTSASSPQLRDAANDARDTSVGRCEEAVVLSGHPAVEAGSPCGYLFRNFAMLHKSELYYYVLDIKRSRLYEFRDDHVIGIEPRSIIPLHAARLEDELISYKSSRGQLFCWKIFLKADEDHRPKNLIFGAVSIEDAEAWIDALRPVTGNGAAIPVRGLMNEPLAELADDFDGSGAAGGKRPGALQTDRNSVASDTRTTTPPDPSTAGSAAGGLYGPLVSPSKARSWKQSVVVCGETFRIQCNDLSTNAWLLSEAIRTYMRRSANEESSTPALVALYNVTQDRLLDLSEDVRTSLVPGDILEALTEEADAVKRLNVQTRAGNGLRHRPTRSQPSLSAPGSFTGDQQGLNGVGRSTPSPKSSGRPKTPPSSQPPQEGRGGVKNGKQPSPAAASSGSPAATAPAAVPSLPSASSTDGAQASVLSRGKPAGTQRPTRLVHGLSWHLNKETIAAQLAHSYQFWDDRKEQESKVLEQFDHLCAALDKKVPFWAGPSWTPESAENGVRMFAHGDSTLGVLVIPANPSAVLERLLDARTQLEWDSTLRRVRYLESARGTDVVHMQTSLRGPFSPRAFCVARFWMRLEDGSYVGTFTPSAHPSCPPADGYVLGSMRCAFLLRSSGRYESLLSFHCELDVGAPLLSSWFNRRAQTAMLSSLAGLREASALI